MRYFAPNKNNNWAIYIVVFSTLHDNTFQTRNYVATIITFICSTVFAFLVDDTLIMNQM